MNLLHTILASDPTFFLPKGASNLAPDVDWAWNVILVVTGIFFCIVVGAMTLFVIRYRRRNPNDATSEITHNTPLEIAWTFIPLIIVVCFFYIGFKGFLKYDTPQSNCRHVEVIGQQWKFTFNYPNGATDSNLYVEEGQPVELDMHSVDVLHALYLPTFRTQRNLIPYRQTSIWFIPTELSPSPTKNDPGGWPIFCTQYCGNGHSDMTAHVYVLKTAEFNEKMTELANPFKKKDANGKPRWVPYVTLGETLYSQLGCNTCHSTNGAHGTGPTWKGLWKRPHEFSNVDPKVYSLEPTDSDEKWTAYLDESIVNPDAKLVRLNNENYHGMPSSFATLLGGSPDNDEKRRAVEEFIKSLGSLPYVKPDPNDEKYDAVKHPDFHPESLAGIKARQAGGAAPPPAQ